MTPTVVDGVDALRGMAGVQLGPGRPVTIEQAQVDGFAELTGDRQWIHTDPERAAAGPFGAPIAHGFLTLSLVGPLTGELLRVEGTSMSVNYGLDRVRFPSPLPVGATVQATAQIVSVSDVAGGMQAVIRVTIAIPGAPKPACVADTVVRFYA